MTFDVAVVGGGIVGCATAYFRAREGMRVVLLERKELPGGSEFRVSGGLICLQQ